MQFHAQNSLSDAEIAENQIQHFFHIDPAGDAADGAHRQAQIFGEQFRLRGASGRAQMPNASLQGMAMARPAQGRAFVLCFQPFSTSAVSAASNSAKPSPVFSDSEMPVAFLKIGRSLLLRTIRSAWHAVRRICARFPPAIQQQQGQMPGGRLRPRPAHPFRFDRVCGLAQARRIGDLHG